MSLCSESMVLIIMKGEKMSKLLDGFKEFLGQKAYEKFLVDYGMLVGIIMAEQNLDVKEAVDYLAKQLQK